MFSDVEGSCDNKDYITAVENSAFAITVINYI